MYGVSHVPHPNRYRSDFGLEGEAADIMAAKYVEQEIENQGPETVAAVIGEPISSAAGVHVPSPIYWQMLREICDRHGVLLIADEVINGFGRTGKMFADRALRHRAGHHDDRQGALLRLRADGGRHRAPGLRRVHKQEMIGMGHLLTFGGHPVAAAAALKNLEIYEEENLVARGARNGRLPARADSRNCCSHPTVAEVRGLGMLNAIQVTPDKATKAKWAKDSKFPKWTRSAAVSAASSRVSPAKSCTSRRRWW